MGSLQPKSVIIVGGSLAGLMHALVILSSANPPSVRILERSPTALLHNQGAGVVAGNETQEFFEKVVRPGREIAITSQLRHYIDREGAVIEGSVENRQQRMTSWDLLYHLLRWRVDGLQSEYVKDLAEDDRPKAQYNNGCNITSIQEAGDQVKVTWTQKDLGEQTASADLVIAADGASSTLRRLLNPDSTRSYAGYVAWRGTVPETSLSASAQEVFYEKFAFYHNTGTQLLGYLIPGENGTLEPGKRLFNFLWYCNLAEGSAELEELMTDVDSKRHAITLPVGKMSPAVLEKQKRLAAEILPPQYAEVVQKTEAPFIQAITDNICSRNSFYDGKVLLIGDALAGFRPHTAASTGQAAFDALRLGELLDGAITREQYDGRVLEFARRVQEHGVMLGERSQFGRHPFAG
jgi:2-polyprenyl-6-methoxyphenol hydroxylase-like FAD-dependent oxidoreductase